MNRRLIFSPKKLLEILGPLVYIVKNKRVFIYVGASGIGLKRTLTNYPVYYKLRNEGCTLQIIPCKTKKAALKIESKLIFAHSPTLNKMGKRIND